jgi:hypothetical protein
LHFAPLHLDAKPKPQLHYKWAWQVPNQEEINQVFLLSTVLYKAILGLHFKRQEQKKTVNTLEFPPTTKPSIYKKTL